MERDLSRFPQDENGDVLWELARKGFDLTGDAEVRFALLFPKFDDALKFGVFLLRQEYRVKVNEIDDKPGCHGEVLVDIYLDTNHKDITESEQWLAEQSAPLGGKNDGWEIKGPRGNPLSAEHHPIGA
jgi:hypothetical protein